MALNQKKNYRELLDEAAQVIVTIPPNYAARLVGSDAHQFIDLREVHERQRHGWIPGSIHGPRGELEFYVDPTCPLFAEDVDVTRSLVLYCAGGWRSALAAKTLGELGFSDVSHIDGGFDRWMKDGYDVATAE